MWVTPFSERWEKRPHTKDFSRGQVVCKECNFVCSRFPLGSKQNGRVWVCAFEDSLELFDEAQNWKINFFCAKYLCELCNFDVNGLFLSRTWINDREHAVMALLGFYPSLAKHTITDTHRRCCSLCVVIILLGARIKFKSENKSPQL